MKLKSAYRKTKAIFRNTRYFHHYYKKELDEKMILIESKNGNDLAGNMFHILKELTSGGYEEYKIYLSCLKRRQKNIEEQLASYQIEHVTLVRTNSNQYRKYLATAKYLFTDTTFPRAYVKKDGQIITNTWHGTPLKKMGKDVGNRVFAMGNVQRNLLFSDYLVYPNDYMKEKMVNAFELQNLYKGTILCEGYPRNSIFFDKNAGQSIKSELGLENKKVYMYMPTWRGTLSKRTTNHLIDMLEYYFEPLDRQLTDDQVFYVKMHPLARKAMDLSKYEHIREYPSQYDVYEFMNMCDCLVTDYSSVFYDFANSKKKIVLFAYDETEYIGERGLYVDLNDLPFPIVKRVDDLVYELNSPKKYDDKQFLRECCTYDNKNAASNICRHVIKGERVCKEEKLKKNGNDNVLLYASALAQNGLTTSLLNLLKNADLEKRNYYISFTERALKKAPRRVEQLPEGVGVLPISSGEHYTFMEAVSFVLYMKLNKEYKFIRKYMDRLYKRELKKYMFDIKMDYVIQFAGYEKKIINLFERFDGPRCIYVHNDMVEEIRTRKNQHYLTLRSAYRNYDKVAVVTKDIKPSTVQISGKEDNIIVVNNCHAHEQIIERSLEPLAYERTTKRTISVEDLEELLESDAKKFITIGRFSPEKGHMMLMKAFERFSEQNPDTYLIIIGGHGVLYNETLKYAKNSDANIIIIKSMKNPMPILRRCDFFILSSYYEGLGLTMLEADSLSIPTMSTDIVGPQGFMREHGGYLVEPTEEGILGGMNAFMEGKVKAMNVDYAQYNKDAIKQFEAIFQK